MQTYNRCEEYSNWSMILTNVKGKYKTATDFKNKTHTELTKLQIEVREWQTKNLKWLSSIDFDNENKFRTKLPNKLRWNDKVRNWSKRLTNENLKY